MKKQDLIEFIPLGLLSTFSIFSIIKVLTTDYIFNPHQFVGLTLLGISFLLFFLHRRTYRYLFGITLLLGTFNLIGFTAAITTIKFLSIPIQILIVPILLIFTWINKEKIESKLKSLFGATEEDLKSEANSKVERFKKKFENLSDEEIERRLNQKLVPEATEALKQIHQQRIITNE